MLLEKVRESLDQFCKEFVEKPYLCYTEHGLHVRFCSILSGKLTEGEKYARLGEEPVCVIQKEYRTAHDLGKSKRQHWDVAVLRNPLEPSSCPAYDNLKIEAAVEFGLNERREHFLEDVRRLNHPESNVDKGFVVHLYRVSNGMSSRDKNPSSESIWPKDDLSGLRSVAEAGLEVYYVMVDRTGTSLLGICNSREMRGWDWA